MRGPKWRGGGELGKAAYIHICGETVKTVIFKHTHALSRMMDAAGEGGVCVSVLYHYVTCAWNVLTVNNSDRHGDRYNGLASRRL